MGQGDPVFSACAVRNLFRGDHFAELVCGAFPHLGNRHHLVFPNFLDVEV